MSVWGQLYFPDSNSEMAARLFYYHDLALVVIVIISVLVLSFLVSFLFSKVFIGESMHLKMKKHELLELGWSTAPFFILFGLGFVSLKNLYAMEVGENVSFLTKVTGHQWYWEYSYNVNFSDVKSGDDFDNFVMSSLLGFNLGSDGFFFTSFNSFVANEWEVSVGDKVKALVPEVSSAQMVASLFVLMSYMPNNEASDISFNHFNSAICSGGWDSVYCLKNFLDMSMSVMDGVDSYIDFSDNKDWASVLSGVSSLYLESDWYFKYDSYIVPEDLLLGGDFFGLKSGFRNQDVSIPCYLVRSEKNEVLVSTADVMHSWGVSELGVKADAVPGRENALKVVPLRSGVAFGFCYELCGAGHSQMPICVFIGNKLDVEWVIKTGILGTDTVADFFSNFV